MKIKYFIYIICLISILVQNSCIEPYELTDQVDFTRKIIVDGLITDESDRQVIKLSYLSSTDSAEHIPLTGATVEVLDNSLKNYIFEESISNPGNYEGIIPLGNFVSGRQFKVHIILYNGEEYESDFDEYTASPAIDSIYYVIKNQETTDPEVVYQGLQFYYNFKGDKSSSRFYRLKLTETWEYKSAYLITVYFSGQFYTAHGDTSLYTCYRTRDLSDVFLLSTQNFNKNEYNKFELQYINNQTSRLHIRYSFLLKQYSISPAIYNFWLNLKKNNQQNGGLYETQPALVVGNIHHVNYPNEIVLGYFGVSSVQQKRIFVTNPGISFPDNNHCDISKPYTDDGWPYGTDPSEWPIYFINYFDPQTGEGTMGIAPADCFDCRLHGGTTTKPDFW